MKTQSRICVLPPILLVAWLAGCATGGKPPPVISLDEPKQERAAQLLPESPTPVEAVAVPQPLALPGQLKPLGREADAKPTPEPADE
jgi:type IV secretion system protein VirB9